MRDHFFDSSDYSPRAVETVLGSYIMAVLFWNGTQLDMVVLLWNGGSNIYKAKKEKSSFSLSTFLQDSSTKTTGLTNLFLRSETRLFLMCGFIELLQNT
jgi:hypothetical protein